MAQPSQVDIIAPFDPTAYATITGAQLLQFLSGAIPYSDKGFTVVTEDVGGTPWVPDGTGTAKWRTYLWIRRSATAISAYLWNPAVADDITYQKWVSINVAAIGVGSITGSMIADFTITDAKIISLDWSKITGAPTGWAPTGAAGGALTGTYPNPSIANAAVTGSMIAAATISHTNIGADAVEIETDVKPSAVGLSLIRTNAGATALEHFVSGQITTLANPAGAGDVGKQVVVANPYTDGFELAPVANLYYKFAVAATALGAGGLIIDTAHGLAGTPQVVSGKLICTSTDAGYAVDDEIDMALVMSTPSGSDENAAFSYGANATKVFVVFDGTPVSLKVLTKAGVNYGTFTAAKWKAKIFAVYYP